MLWSMAVLSHPHETALAHLAQASLQRLKTSMSSKSPLKSTGVGNTFWVIAKSGGFKGAVADNMVFNVIHVLHGLSARDLTGICWACAHALHHDPPLLLAISWVCDSSMVATISAQHLANLSWAFARLHAKWRGEARFSTELWGAVAARIEEFKAHELSITMWAVAKLGLPEDVTLQHLQAIESAAVKMLQGMHFGPQELSNLAIAIARLFVRHDFPEKHSLSILMASASERAAELQPQHVANMMWCLGHSRFRHGAFEHASTERLHGQMSSFAKVELVNIIWSVARLSTSIAT